MPRTFFRTIAKEILYGNGWECWGKDKQVKTFTVLSGKYVGTWSFHPNKVTYGFDFDIGHSTGKLRKLASYRQNLITEHRNQLAKRFKYLSYYYRSSNTLYIASELSNYPIHKIEEDIKIYPDRINILEQFLKIFRGIRNLNNRIKFATKFFQTWSIHQALPKCFKRIANWKDYITNINYLNGEYQILPTGYNVELSISYQIFSFSYVQNISKNILNFLNRVTTKRHIIQTFISSTQKNSIFDLINQRCIYDLINTIIYYYNIPREFYQFYHPKFQYFEQLILNKKWHKIISLHNEIVTIQRDYFDHAEANYSSKKRKAADDFYANCPFKDTDLITYFRNKEQFDNEGKEMQHCVSTYFNMMKSYCGHFTYNNNPYTFEISTDASRLLQLRGPGNLYPDQEVFNAFCIYLKNLKKETNARNKSPKSS